MIARVYAATDYGFEGKCIEVECDASNGLPGMLIVGLGNKSVDEARERVRSAIKNSGLDFPRKRVTINLAPANLPKHGAHYDLAIAVALLVVSGQLPQTALDTALLVGELALDGSLRPIRGAVNYAETARDKGLEYIIVPEANATQATLVEGIRVLPATSLKQVFLHLTGQESLPVMQNNLSIATPASPKVTFSDIYGQEQAKRALLIAASGHHNLLINGPPGAGKTLLAHALVSLLPPLTASETVDVTKLHSLAGETYDSIITSRPFRAPHHSSSHVALVGGGTQPRPGEISLAHRGVLFLDELPEYSRQALEALRQPLEERAIHISRANSRVSYPADFMLIATQNPCPCGYAGDQEKDCSCTPIQLANYRKKLSGPLLDRIDMMIDVQRVPPSALLVEAPHTQNNPVHIVLQAHERQHQRFQSLEYSNAHLNSKNIDQTTYLTQGAKQLLDRAAASLHLSARSYFKTIKVARTIADIENSEHIEPTHVSEALQYRPRNSDY